MKKTIGLILLVGWTFAAKAWALGISTTVKMDEDSAPTPFSLTLNAGDPVGETITWSISQAASNGVASVSGTGTEKPIQYIPNANYNGTDQFSVQVVDPYGGTATFKVKVTIRPRNDAPNNPVAPVVSGTNHVGQQLTVSQGVWNDNAELSPGTLSYRTQWRSADNANGLNVADIAGATNATYVLQPAEHGQYVQAAVFAYDNGEGLPLSQTTTVYTVWQLVTGLPAITLAHGDQTVDYAFQNYSLSGTNNLYVVGTIFWTNAATGSGGTFGVQGSEFRVSNIALAVGHNRITVSGTNAYNHSASDSVTITRQTQSPGEPFWWYQRGLILTHQGNQDFALANQGQLKWFATNACAEFNAKLTNGAGSNITALVNGFVNADNYVVVNQGQVKNVAKPFYDRLWELGLTNRYPIGVGTNKYPWDSSTNAPSDYLPANIGQLKYLFSFEVE